MRKGKLILHGAGAVAVVLAWFTAASCSANSDGGGNVGTGATGGDSGGSGSSGTGGSSGNSTGGGNNASGTGGGAFLDGSVGDADADTCAGESYAGQLAPLDVYVLLDATASMDGAGDSAVVWPEVTKALIDLASDPMTEGIGIGLTYLPVPPAAGFTIPGSCNGPGDNCGGKGNCVFVGAAFGCDAACTMATAAQDCGLYGPCMAIPTMGNFCQGAFSNVSCNPEEYGQPVVPIAELPGNKDNFVQAIKNKAPDGDSTPTQPSLAGAHIYAHQWALDHPDHLVHVLFATDGEPINCTNNSIDGTANVAKTAFEGTPSVPTFVLGIGQLDALDPIAKAGGTEQAYIASGATVAGEIVKVFNEIRANGACIFQIPVPPDGQTPDFERVNVYYTPLGATEREPVKYVGSEAECDPDEGGWYFDDPTKADPKQILLCPATCEAVRLSEDGVQVELGCKTIVK